LNNEYRLPASEPPPSVLACAVGAQVPARILIVDDHFAARTTIRSLLDWHSFEVCGDTKDGKEAIDKVIELKPDIVILDINMPVMDGLTAAHEIRRISPATKIVFLTIHDAPANVKRTRLWAHGFVPKAAAGTELIPTLNRIVGVSGNPPTRPKPRRSPTH
jgi:two-component system response regulator NreC